MQICGRLCRIANCVGSPPVCLAVPDRQGQKAEEIGLKWQTEPERGWIKPQGSTVVEPAAVQFPQVTSPMTTGEAEGKLETHVEPAIPTESGTATIEGRG
jgi:hypothetical protein